MSVKVGKVFLTLKRRSFVQAGANISRVSNLEQFKFLMVVILSNSSSTSRLKASPPPDQFVGRGGELVTYLSCVATLHSWHLNSHSSRDSKRGSAHESIASRSGKANTGVSSLPGEHKVV